MCDYEEVLVVDGTFVLFAEEPLGVQDFVQHQIFAVEHSGFFAELVSILRATEKKSLRRQERFYLGNRSLLVSEGTGHGGSATDMRLANCCNMNVQLFNQRLADVI